MSASRRVHQAMVAAVVDRGRRRGPWEPDVEAVLGAIDPARLDRVAESLLDKRVGELARAVPAAVAVFPALLMMYRGWLARRPAPVADDAYPPGVREGLRAEAALLGFADVPWIAELLRFELWRAASRADGRERVLRARWAVGEVARAVADGAPPFEPEERASVYVFGRTPDRAVEPRQPGASRVAPPAPGAPAAAVSYRRPWARRLLEGDGPVPDALEVVADHFFAPHTRRELAALAERYPIVVHDVGCSVATGGPTPERLARLVEVVRAARAVGFTDHLAVTAAGFDVGHLLAPWPSIDTVNIVIDAVNRLQDALGVPCSLENVSAGFRPPGDFHEADLLHRVVERTGCGLLLDLTNLVLDARNDGLDPLNVARQLPLAAARAAHLAGGRAEGDWWIDSHSAPVEEAVYDLLASLRGELALDMVIVERDHRLPALDELVREARRAADVARGSRSPDPEGA